MSCVIVLGCFRSGTSAVAGILHKLGVHMGDSFDPPSHANPEGFFEDLVFKKLVEEWSVGKDVKGLVKINSEIRNAEHKLWGVKFPKLCVLLNQFIPLTETDCKVIVCRRPKEDICNSMAKAIGYSSGDQYKVLVDYYVSRMEASLADFSGPKLEVDFASIVSDPKKEAERIAEFVGLPLNEEALNHVCQKKNA